jgi:hypothetical protein
MTIRLDHPTDPEPDEISGFAGKIDLAIEGRWVRLGFAKSYAGFPQDG